VQFDNNEYFAKTQLTPTESTYTLACVVMKGLNAYISLRGDEGVNQCTSAFRACSFMVQFIQMH